jgi:osmotically-inducible protein OsmY
MKISYLMGCVLLSSATVLIGGCAPAVVGGAAVSGAVTGAVISQDRRSAGTIVDDQGIEFNIGSQIGEDKELADRIHVSITSYNYVVLLTGEAPDEALRNRIYEYAQQVDHVRLVYNEITVANLSPLMSRSGDTLLTGKVKTALANDKRIEAGHVKVTTDKSVVYLMGLVTQEEGRVAAEVARRISGVQKVVKLFEYIAKSSAPQDPAVNQ